MLQYSTLVKQLDPVIFWYICVFIYTITRILPMLNFCLDFITLFFASRETTLYNVKIFFDVGVFDEK